MEKRDLLEKVARARPEREVLTHPEFEKLVGPRATAETPEILPR